MRVTFQIIHNFENIDAVIFDAFKIAYENLYIEKSDDEFLSLYYIKYNLALRNSKFIAGFAIEVEEVSPEDYDTFIDFFAEGIKGNEYFYALLKFQDDTRIETYLNYYKEIAELEMQLREVLSFIFYYEYSSDFYNLLEEYEVNFSKDFPQQDQLQKHLENQFFYLTFSNYLSLDKPKEIRQVKDINSILKGSDSYEEFRDKICNRGIKNEKHLEFMVAIKQDLKTIESVRNSIAHNRIILSTKLGHYETARNHLQESFNEFWEEF